MPNIRLLSSLPNEDGLYAALEKMEATDAASITILRKRSQHEPLRNIISGLWFAILYRAVERHTGHNKAVRKDARCRAIHNLTACLRAGNEISGHNNNISKMISKRMRSGVASSAPAPSLSHDGLVCLHYCACMSVADWMVAMN
jgi:hypothetical protein